MISAEPYLPKSFIKIYEPLVSERFFILLLISFLAGCIIKLT